MHDLKFIRENPGEFDAGLKRRGLAPASPDILRHDSERRQLQTDIQALLARRNEASRAIGQAKAKGLDTAPLMSEVADIKTRIPELETREKTIGDGLDTILASIPNLPAADVPTGKDEAANVELRRSGRLPNFSFPVQDHVALGEGLRGMDFAAAAKLAGARFVVLRGALARLERALGAFMIDIHVNEFGYTEIAPPLLARSEAAFGVGQLPKFAEDLFHTDNGFWMIPTAELPLTNLVRDDILDEAALPLRFTALTPCFRSEAGAAGKDTRGMIRQHQFNKVELVSITTAEHSPAEHERMTACATTLLDRLELPYRVMVLSTGDMGFCARKTYDIEVWLPGQNAYREISSCSNCGDFQARRMQARYRPTGEKGTRFVHTLNGSGLAVGRTLIALLENYQEADGSITIPPALRPYMGGMTKLTPP